MNSNNLILNSERSPDELREMGRKGGIASGAVRRKKRDIIKAAKLWMQVFDDLEKQDEKREKQIYKELTKNVR